MAVRGVSTFLRSSRFIVVVDERFQDTTTIRGFPVYEIGLLHNHSNPVGEVSD